MLNKKKENSVRSLVSLYTVVMGVALSVAITNTINTDTGLRSVPAVSLFLFFSFIVTLFPFYHGALRHLDDAYIENESSQIKDGAIIFDVLLLLLHGIAFVVLSQLMKTPNEFAWILISLLSIDVVWGLFVHFGSSSSGDHLAEWKWTIVNFVTICVGISYLVYHDIYFAPLEDPLKLAIPITAVCTIRTIVDYMWGKDFYFPKLK